MKRSLALFVLFLISNFLIIAQPKIQIVGGDTYEWKRATPKDNPLTGKITIKNVGNQLLIINNIIPSCGCTSTSDYKKELQPGESTTFEVTLRIGGYSGEVTKSVRIISNDQDTPTKYLTLKANIVQPVDVLPNRYFSFTDMRVGNESQFNLKIKNNSDKEVTLSDFQTTPDFLHINLKGKKVIKPGKDIELIVKAKPDKVGRFNCSIKFTTNNPDAPTIEIFGSGDVKESALYNPK